MYHHINQFWLEIYHDFIGFLASFPLQFWHTMRDGTSDVPKSLLLVLMIYGLWSISIPKVRFRPVRDFTLWAVRYPVPSLVLLALTLIVWGVIGKGFGLQDLLLDNNPLTAFELGALVSLLVLSLILQYFILDTQISGWVKSLEVAT